MGPGRPLTSLGLIALWLLLLLGCWGAVTGTIGSHGARHDLLQSSRRAAYAQFGVSILAVFSLCAALVRPDFNLEYVAANASRTLPAVYRVVASLAGVPGTVLWMMSLVSGAAAWIIRGEPADHRPAVRAALLLGLGALLEIAWLQPFDRLPFTPLDGAGLDPRYRTAGGVVELALLVAGAASLVLAVLRERAAFAAFGLLSAGVAVGAWRWYAILSPEGQQLFGGNGAAVLAAWLIAGTWFLVRVNRPRARITAAAGFLASIGWLVALLLGRQGEVTVAAGETVALSMTRAALELTHVSVSRFEIPGGVVSAGTIDVGRPGELPRTLVSERRVHFDVVGRPLGSAVIQPALYRGAVSDVRIELASAATQTDVAVYRVRAGPPAWLGALAFVILMAGILPGFSRSRSGP